MKNSQKGAALLVALIMVLLLSIISVSSIKTGHLQEAMAGNMRERNIALQAAESALREGETKVSDLKERPTITNIAGLFTDRHENPLNSVLYFSASDWLDMAKVQASLLALKHVHQTPNYVIEELQPDIGMGAAMEGSAIDVEGMQVSGDLTPYRVSSRGFGALPNSVKTLQTTYNRRFFQ